MTHSWQRKNPNKILNKYTIMSEVAWFALEEVLKNPNTVKNGFRSAGEDVWIEFINLLLFGKLDSEVCC